MTTSGFRVRKIDTMLRAALNFIRSPINRSKMTFWTAKIERIISSPPGSDDGFSSESIARNAKVTFLKMSTWAIVCEEMVDTQRPRIYFGQARDELRRRGIDDVEYMAMRRFAWLTAGWLNFEMMLWDWCGLDEQDIYRAIDWQFTDGWISADERDRRKEYARRYDRAD